MSHTTSSINPQVPPHLPSRLTISLWDFSWYTMTTEGEPFADLDRTFAEAVERGYNTVRLCGMPVLLFTDDGPRGGTLELDRLGGEVGQRTRWYTCTGGARLDGIAHLLALFRAARKHDCYVILSSWEYQQSFSFLAEPTLYDALRAVPVGDRAMTIAKSMHRLIDHLKAHQLDDCIAYVEVHNEVEWTMMASDRPAGQDPWQAVAPMQPPAIAYLRKRHPEILITTCFASFQLYRQYLHPENGQVAHFHLYEKDVLQDLDRKVDLRGAGEFPSEFLASMLRDDAPLFEDYRLPPDDRWKLGGNPNGERLMYYHDWIDPVKYDLYLYEHWPEYRRLTLEGITLRLEAQADWARRLSIPCVVGEGFLGYTPYESEFEGGPVGKAVAEHAIAEIVRLGFWGSVTCSNAAPHHPMWTDVAWQRRMNDLIRRS